MCLVTFHSDSNTLTTVHVAAREWQWPKIDLKKVNEKILALEHAEGPNSTSELDNLPRQSPCPKRRGSTTNIGGVLVPLMKKNQKLRLLQHSYDQEMIPLKPATEWGILTFNISVNSLWSWVRLFACQSYMETSEKWCQKQETRTHTPQNSFHKSFRLQCIKIGSMQYVLYINHWDYSW